MLEEDAEPDGSARQREATVADVARLAKVSKATAARALGGYGSVNEDTRLRVLDAADAVGYLPNALARTMSTGRSHTIGVVLSDIENPFFAKATRAISDVVQSAGFDVVLCNTDENPHNEAAAIDLLLEKRVAGLIVAPADRNANGAVARVTAQGRPLVLFDRTVDDFECDSVIADNRRGAYELARVLLRAGHRRIAFLSTLGQQNYRRGDRIRSTSVADRVDGFEAALDEAGVEIANQIVLLDGERPGIDPLLTHAVHHGATAIIASDSLIAQHVLHGAKNRGLAVPEELSLVAFDDPPWTSLSNPPVTVMAQPIHDIGAEAARLLVRRLDGLKGDVQRIVMSQRLIERDSVAPPRVKFHDLDHQENKPGLPHSCE
jgi:LacI family transcriptional regulator